MRCREGVGWRAPRHSPTTRIPVVEKGAAEFFAKVQKVLSNAILNSILAPEDRLAMNRMMFERLFNARGAARHAYFTQLQTTIDAGELLAIGLAEYRERGNFDRLILTSRLLHGIDSFEALKGLFRGRSPEAFYFVGLVCESEFSTDKQRLQLLLEATKIDDPDLGERVIESCRDLPRAQAILILEGLSNHADEAVRDEAAELLQDLRQD